MDNILESTTDQRREDIITTAILDAFPHLTLAKCPPLLDEADPKFAKLDRVVFKQGEPIAYLEYRCRNIMEDTYGDVALNFRKYQTMQQVKAKTGLPVFFVVLVNSGVLWRIEVSQIIVTYVKPGSPIKTRANHGVGPHDEEPMIKIFFPGHTPEGGCTYHRFCTLSDALRDDLLATWEEDADRRAHPLKYLRLPHSATFR